MLSPAPSIRRQRGLSIVELLVGVAVGLFLLGGATKLFVDYLLDNRRVLVETRVHQDLRAAADLVVRDLRRAGYWADASSGMVALGAASAPMNPFRDIVVTDDDANAANGVNFAANPGQIAFSYDRAASGVETSGFRVRSGALQMQLGSANWQEVTDGGSVLIDIAQLDAPVRRTVELYQACPCMDKLDCVAADFAASGVQYATRPRMTVRQYTLRLSGYAPNLPAIRREIRETVRVRNDEACGVCPDTGATVPTGAPVCS